MKNRKPSVRKRLASAYAPSIMTRADLLAAGMTAREITSSVRSGVLRRLRRDRYARADLDEHIAEAVRIGGRISCLSLLRSIGVFVLGGKDLHVHVRPGSSRIRPPARDDTVLHWDTWSGAIGALHAADLCDAVRHSIRCQPARATIATLDSLLHQRLISLAQLREVFATLPVRFRPLLVLVDARAESGPETFMRLILRALGVQFETQVTIAGVGRVDFVVEGWLIIECDSREFHEGWDKQVEDRARDIAAARLGYVSIRPLATDIMHRSPDVREAISAVIRAFARS